MNISINDVLTGPAVIPFTQRPGWLDIQAENNILKKLRMHMKGGTIPARNIKGEKELKFLTASQSILVGCTAIPVVLK